MRGLYKQNIAPLVVLLQWIERKTIRKSTKETDYEKAVTFLMGRREEVKAGQDPELKIIADHTFADLAKEYLVWAKRQRSFVTKERFINQLVDRFGDMKLRQFNTRILEQYQSDRKEKGMKHKIVKKKADGTRVVCESDKDPKPNKPATINRHIATIKHMFTKAVEWDMVEEEVLKRVRRVKLLEENNRRLRYLSKDECQELLRECDSHVKPIVTMALNTGMRKEEILGLTWDRVDLKHGFILLEHTKNGERREIPINNTLRATLKSLTRRLDVRYVFFDGETAKRYQDVKKGFSGACRRAGIADFHFHDLRHTFASHLVMVGVDLTTVKELLGHKDIKMTLRYAHLAPSHKVKAVDILDGTINETATSYLLHSGKGENLEI
jgi:integrase